MLSCATSASCTRSLLSLANAFNPTYFDAFVMHILLLLTAGTRRKGPELALSGWPSYEAAQWPASLSTLSSDDDHLCSITLECSSLSKHDPAQVDVILDRQKVHSYSLEGMRVTRNSTPITVSQFQAQLNSSSSAVKSANSLKT
jgi:hypothetical protein